MTKLNRLTHAGVRYSVFLLFASALACIAFFTALLFSMTAVEYGNTIVLDIGRHGLRV